MALRYRCVEFVDDSPDGHCTAESPERDTSAGALLAAHTAGWLCGQGGVYLCPVHAFEAQQRLYGAVAPPPWPEVFGGRPPRGPSS